MPSDQLRALFHQSRLRPPELTEEEWRFLTAPPDDIGGQLTSSAPDDTRVRHHFVAAPDEVIEMTLEEFTDLSNFLDEDDGGDA